jgi:hypothetical protein
MMSKPYVWVGLLLVFLALNALLLWRAGERGRPGSIQAATIGLFR